MNTRTLTILLLTGVAMSVSGLASATNASSSQAVSAAAPSLIQASVKTTSKRRIIRKALPSENRVMKVYSDKNLIDVSKDVSSKSRIVRPATTTARTPNLYGG